MPIFGVRVSVTFRLTCVHIILDRFGLLSGHLLVNLEIAVYSVDRMFSLGFFYFFLFPVLVLMGLLQFLIFAYVLLLPNDVTHNTGIH